MLQQQEYPKKIQPRSSSTRQCQEEQQQLEEMTEDKVDAEASRILMDLANQENTTPLKNLLETMTLSNEGTIQQQQQQQDPIMLLAAAAAAIDDGGRYKKRSYERREIKLQSRYDASKRKSISQEEMHDIRRHRANSKSSVSSSSHNTWNHTSEIKGNDPQHAFSWQYLSMKKNPRIKRNAMHAYITYMIYTDMAHSNHQYNSKVGYSQKEQERHQQDGQKYGGLATGEREYHNNNNSNNTNTNNDTNTNTNTSNGAIMSRPLTDFLFEHNNKNNSSNSNGRLLPPIQQASSATSSSSATYERSSFV